MYAAWGFIFLINYLSFFWAYFMQSDKLTDLMYSISFVSVALAILVWGGDYSLDKILLVSMVVIWGIRLGAYLFMRIHQMKKDDRFDERRESFIGFGMFWTLQALTVSIVMIPVIIYLGKESVSLGFLHYLGMAMWLLGLVVESVADQQKFAFKSNEANKGQFMRSGIWKYSQHPNYAGEMLCWIGVFLFCVPALVGWEWLSIISPIWIVFLLLFVSGIPYLKKSANKKYGHLEAYQDYKKNTPLLFPLIS